jgi:hypothetical protein
LIGIKSIDEGHTFTKSKRGGTCMNKPTKNKKDKVPKITEAEYAAYLSSLRELTEGNNPALNTDTGAPSELRRNKTSEKG